MRKMSRNPFIRNLIILISVTLGAVGLDRLTKDLCMKNMELGESIEVLPGVFNLTYIHNRGAAFGSFADSRWVFMIASVVMLAVILVYVLLNRNMPALQTLCLAMILGGGVGNMIDRLALGYVIDFADVKFIPGWKWIFNVADSFVCVGALLLVVLFIIDEAKNKKEEEKDVKTES